MTLRVWLGKRFARLATNAVLRRQGLWRVFRRPLTAQFGRLARSWEAGLRPDHLAPLEVALDAVPEPPARVLDVGTGTGLAAFAAARRWPDAEVVGVDVSASMVEEARRKGSSDRVRFEVADAEALPFAEGSFDLVTVMNMIPFFDELARVVAAGGAALFAFSSGADTPIYVPPERLRAELGRRGFTDFAEFTAGRGTALLARKRPPA